MVDNLWLIFSRLIIFSGTELVHSLDKLLESFDDFIRASNHLEYLEFETYYRGLSIGLGESPVDNISSDQDYALLTSLLPSSQIAQNYFVYTDRTRSSAFEKILCSCWTI